MWKFTGLYKLFSRCLGRDAKWKCVYFKVWLKQAGQIYNQYANLNKSISASKKSKLSKIIYDMLFLTLDSLRVLM